MLDLAEQARFVFVGDVGAGKSTAITTLSEGRVMSMDVPLSEEVEIDDKFSTTVGFDFAVLPLGDTPLFLYGTPGQERFQFVADDLISGALGAILLVNVSATDALGSCRRWLDLLAAAKQRLHVVIALNRMSLSSPSLNDFRSEPGRGNVRILGVQVADPRSRSEMLSCLRLLTLRAMNRVDPDTV
ncbi:MAG: ATP/GTP-binding protein [Xanthomonadales bacterium]|jgi:hypothetical protein|nr:ATP/GTP-binding protein [Xanthomonadales bacterium]